MGSSNLSSNLKVKLRDAGGHAFSLLSLQFLFLFIFAFCSLSLSFCFCCLTVFCFYLSFSLSLSFQPLSLSPISLPLAISLTLSLCLYLCLLSRYVSLSLSLTLFPLLFLSPLSPTSAPEEFGCSTELPGGLLQYHAHHFRTKLACPALGCYLCLAPFFPLTVNNLSFIQRLSSFFLPFIKGVLMLIPIVL